MAAQATGAVELAEGNPPVAAGLLRRAWQVWQELDAPYPAARARVLLGGCCRALGDGTAPSWSCGPPGRCSRALGARPTWPAWKLRRSEPRVAPTG